MNFSIPRVMIAGTGSGCGKTSVTCAVLGALRKRGSDLSAFKCGPDYIDPMFHSRILGTESANLDSFFFPDNTLKYLLAGRGRGKDLSVIEGVMGFYDGIGMESGKASSCEIARITETPVILVLDADPDLDKLLQDAYRKHFAHTVRRPHDIFDIRQIAVHGLIS